MDASITLPVVRPVARLRLALVASAVASAVLYTLRGVGEVLTWPLRILAALVHEMGHGVAGLLAGGTFERLQVWPNGAGVTEVEGLGTFAVAIMAAGGLIGPAIAAAAGFALGRTPQGARTFLIVGGAGLLIAEVLVVRGLFSLVFAGVLALVCLALGLLGPPNACQWGVVFLSVQLALNLLTEAGYLFMDRVVIPEGTFPSDTGLMAQALVLPYWFWGIACGVISLGVLAQGVRTYWGK
jgi:hypothetical protein